MADLIPVCWVECTLGDIATVKNGFAFKSSEFSETGIPVIRISDINGSLVSSAHAVKITERNKFNNFKVSKGDILIAMSGATTGKFGVYQESEPAYQNQRVGNIRPLSIELNKSFLFYYIFNAKRHIEKDAYGGAQPNISSGKIEQLNFWLPPLNEQKRIVAKIEELFSELDNGIAALKTAREQLKVYRQAVLKHAFEGKLTEQWRKDNADKLETPEQLLARIQQERETRYQQQLEKWKTAVKAWEANGKEGKKPGKPAKPKEIQAAVVAEFELPAKWAISELGLIAYESVLGKMLDKQKNLGEERPYLGNINVRWGRFEIDALKTMKIEESEEARYSLFHGDLVICEGGEPGRCAVWSGEDNVIFIQKALHRVRFTASYMPEFAYYFLVYSVPLERVVKHFTGTTIKHLTGAGLSKVQLPVCSAAEQQEIVSIIESKLSEIDALNSELNVQLNKAETLRQSILKKAFSGQLVPQDPSDEPASELLARIQAEKAASDVKAKKAPAKRGRKAKEVSE